MRHGALQGQKLAHEVNRSREPRAAVQLLEPEMVVAVRILGGTAGLHHVDLRSDPVSGAEPGLAYQLQPRVGVVVQEGGRVFEGVFAEGVPDAVVFAGRGEVVAF